MMHAKHLPGVITEYQCLLLLWFPVPLCVISHTRLRFCQECATYHPYRYRLYHPYEVISKSSLGGGFLELNSYVSAVPSVGHVPCLKLSRTPVREELMRFFHHLSNFQLQSVSILTQSKSLLGVSLVAACPILLESSKVGALKTSLWSLQELPRGSNCRWSLEYVRYGRELQLKTCSDFILMIQFGKILMRPSREEEED